MKHFARIAVAALALTAAAGTVSAQTVNAKAKTKVSVKKTETEADLMKIAKVSKDEATKTALAQVPGSTVAASELERENGHLLWSFDLKTAGKTGIDEVQVNAMTGKIIGKTAHESPKTEKKEAKQEAKEKK